MGGAFLSFIGYHLVLIPFGAILGPWLAHMNLSHPGVVHQAAFLTAAVSAVMGGTGVLYPNFYRGIGGALFGALLALLVVSVISLFVPALAHLAVIHWIAAGIFALYIGYDMWRASDVPATLDNAVDIAISLYLDVINLFLRIASILSSDD
jgi:FtsH-binding integral membrane protein